MSAHLAVPTLALAALAALPARAQAPSPWAALAVPGGVVASQCQSLGKLVCCRDGDTLHAWSAITRTWSSHAVGAGAPLRLHNDCLLALDGGAWIAYSAFTGAFAALPVGPAAVLHNGASAQNDALLAVSNQGQLHTFSALDGAWRGRPIAPGFQVAVQRNVCLLADGALVSAMAAATGAWRDRPVAATPTQLDADGGAGFAWGAGRVHAYSAMHDAWTEAAELPGATFVRGDDWGAFLGADRAFAYSAIRHVVAGLPRGGLQATGAQDLFGLFDDGTSVVAFSARAGAWSPALAPTGATASARGSVALLTDAGGVRAYSAVHNDVAPLPWLPSNSGVADLLAWARPMVGGAPWFFSAVTGAWIEGPQGLATDPLLTTTAAAAPTAGGCVAFSPRTGRFVPLADPTAVLYGNPSSAPLVAVGATQAHAFDARQDRWVATPRSGTGAVTPQIWRTTALLVDGGMAAAFAAQTGAWSTQALPGPIASLRANSESLRLATGTTVLAWSALAGAGWFAQYPEFRRVQPVDAPATWWCDAPPGGGFVVPCLGLPSAAAAVIPGLGNLLLRPTDAVALPARALAPAMPAVGRLPAPAAWPFVAAEVGLQAVCLPNTGSPYLTELATLRAQ